MDLMEIEELIVGDWVFYEGEPVCIDNISHRKIGIWIERDYKEVPIIDTEPIPLDDEIFELNGFDGFEDEGIEIQENTAIGVTLKKTEDNDFYSLEPFENLMEIRYVHELQNLLRFFPKWKQKFKFY